MGSSSSSTEARLAMAVPISMSRLLPSSHLLLRLHPQTRLQRLLPLHLFLFPPSAPSLKRPFLFLLSPPRFSSSSSSACLSPHSPPAPPKLVCVLENIHLTELEKKIFDTLKAVLSHYKLNTQLRVAGGWVRDKLLGEECCDIDIAIDNMLGKAFCRKVYRYLRRIGAETHGFGVIQSNPMQSKHLEVARMQIFGVLIDFVNLRSDTYTDNSCISTRQGFGTATEDAYRRDLTINSLFYNINTSTVEDPTGRGISDLKAGFIATPLPPKVTFMDDPLRVLRAVRFGARFGYELDNELKKAAVDRDVTVALRSKVSRERIGQEIDRMFLGSEPIKAVQQLVELQLFPIIFSPPAELEMTVPEGIERVCMNTLEAVWEVMNYFGVSKLTADDRKICLLGAFLSPFKAFQYEDHKNKMIPVSTAIVKESLKMRSIDAARVANLHKAAEEFQNICKLFLSIDDVFQENEKETDQKEEWKTLSYSYRAGLLLRQIKGLWRAALLLSSVLEEPAIGYDLSAEEKRSQFIKRSKQCLSVEDTILRLGFENLWEHNPLLDGKAMAEIGLKGIEMSRKGIFLQGG